MGEEYKKCPIYAGIWQKTHTPNAEWPKGIKVFGDRMYFDDRLCIPLSLQKAWIREHHAFLGHVGPERLWYHLEPVTEFALVEEAKEFVFHVMRQCETCQATQRAHRLAGPLEPTPVPSRIMTHVALDLFHMPEVKEGENIFDMMAVCIN